MKKFPDLFTFANKNIRIRFKQFCEVPVCYKKIGHTQIRSLGPRTLNLISKCTDLNFHETNLVNLKKYLHTWLLSKNEEVIKYSFFI